MTFALADTDSNLRMLLSSAMSRRFPEADILQFQSGKAVLRTIRTRAIDAMVCALVLPELDGIGLLEEMKPLRKRPRVMVLTQVTNETLLTRTLNLGADYYMIKPVDPPLVCKRLGELLCDAPKPINEPLPPRDCAQILTELGLPARFSGYQYMLCAVELSREDPTRLARITTDLYPCAGERFGKSAANVERSIRYAVDLIFSRNSTLALSNCLCIEKNQLRQRPGNRAFLSMLANALADGSPDPTR